MAQFGSIFEYWKDKAITEDGRVVIDIGYEGADEVDTGKSIAVIEDWGEPCCFACNAPLFDEDDDIETPSLHDLWENKTHAIHYAERAHIVPRAKGGKAEASNMFCLCQRCHHESPDTIYATEFFRWVYQRRKNNVPDMAFRECLDRKILPLFFAEDIQKANSHGTHMMTSSIVAALVGSAEERNRVMPRIGGWSGEDLANALS